eukprot:2998317-Rhodomonas_salina.1
MRLLTPSSVAHTASITRVTSRKIPSAAGSMFITDWSVMLRLEACGVAGVTGDSTPTSRFPESEL